MVFGKALLRNSGAAIAERRHELGLSQEDLAQMAGLHRNTVGKIERGEVSANLTGLNHIYLCLRASNVLIDRDAIILGDPMSDPESEALCGISPASMLDMIACALRGRRHHLGTTLQQTARRAGLHHNTVWLLEHGRLDPSLETIVQLFHALDIRDVSVAGGVLSFS